MSAFLYADKSKGMALGWEEGLECEVSVDGMRLLLEFKYFDVFWMNQVQMRQNVVGKRRVGRELQVLSDLWLMLGFCSLSMLGSCMSHCLCLFLCRVVRQRHGKRWRAQGLGL